MNRIVFLFVLLCQIVLSRLAAGENSLNPGWPEPTDTSRPWTRWWWPGSAVSEQGLTHQLEALSEAGVGGVEITPIYGARGWEENYVEYLSPRWVELLAYASSEAKRLEMQIDMATGTGWPFGGPHVAPENAASRISWEKGEPVIELTEQKVKRAAPGGEGLVLDPFSEEAMADYLERFDDAFAALPEGAVRAQFHDSFEYYGANWTDGFPGRFEEMHGYAIDEWLPALLGEQEGEWDEETIARLKHDYRITLDVLHQEYLQAWAAWAHGRGWQVRNQSHGAPANLLDLYAVADIPETEIFGSTPFPIPGLRRDPKAIRHGLDLPEPLVTRMASSAAHVSGKRLVSSETATWLRDHWKASLAMVKPEIDRIFLDGINHVFYHGTVYSPPDAEWPGWLFYASTQINPNNPWWEDASGLNQYVERAQRVLQGGSPGNDVLLYWPAHEIWQDPGDDLAKQLTVHDAGFVLDRPFGAVARKLKGAGYAFDYVSDRQVTQLEVVDGKLKAPGGAYATLIVPPAEVMPVDTLAALLRLAEDGAVVAFVELPKDVPGWGELEKRRAEFRRLLDAARGTLPRESGGRVFIGGATQAAQLAAAAREPMFDHGLECIRRKSGVGTDYFIANLTDETFDGWVALGSRPSSMVLLDPLTGRGGVAALRQEESGEVELRLQLAAGETIIARGLEAGLASGEVWTYLEPAGAAKPVDGPWLLSFEQGGPALPADAEMKTLRSWTELDDPDAERFAGTARYVTDFELSAEQALQEWVLDLGDLRDSARVRVNGQDVGTVWSLPFRIRVGDYVRGGENKLEIAVTNVAANRVRDLDRRGVDWKIMREINFVDIGYKPFDASGWEVEPAGLLGPVRLTPMREVPR